MGLMNTIVINDVGPRDGLQNQPKILSTDDRLAMISALSDANVSNIEIGAFVSPKAVPAMAGTNDVAECLRDKQGSYSASWLRVSRGGWRKNRGYGSIRQRDNGSEKRENVASRSGGSNLRNFNSS